MVELIKSSSIRVDIRACALPLDQHFLPALNCV